MITYKEYDTQDQVITISLNTGGELTIDMELEVLYLNGENGLDFSSDDAKDVYYKINGELYTALQVIQWAQNNHQEIHAAAEQEEASESDYQDEVSSPYWSGRV